MRCLYVLSEDPISPNYLGGASGMYYDQLMALSDLGHEIHVWHFACERNRKRFNEFVNSEPGIWKNVISRCHSVQFFDYPMTENLFGRIWNCTWSVLRPQKPFPRWSALKEFRKIFSAVKPGVVWAQHFLPATVAVQQREVPVIYVHHDWLYKIKALRNHREIDVKQQSAEEWLVRSVAAVVCGSKIECDQILKTGARKVHYIPVSYEPIKIDLEAVKLTEPRLIHLGGMATTANREGLLAFFDRVWPNLKQAKMEFQVIGDISSASPKLKENLKSVKCTGFVANLEETLRPFDLHIIPWEHATGQRTRIPLAFNFAQVVVATKDSAACYPEAKDGVNCRLVDHLEDMASIILELRDDASQRIRLGHSARTTFEKNFTRSALLPRYAEVVASIQQN